jgi:hypothetical protein
MANTWFRGTPSKATVTAGGELTLVLLEFRRSHLPYDEPEGGVNFFVDSKNITDAIDAMRDMVQQLEDHRILLEAEAEAKAVKSSEEVPNIIYDGPA